MAAPYPPTPATATPSTRVELHISCDNLRDADLFSKSDPVVVVYTQTRSKQWVEIARTEWIQNTLSPRFSRAVLMDYRFEEVQQLQFSVYDIDNDTPSMNDDDFLGCIKCTLGEIVSAVTYTKPLESGTGKKSRGKLGTITIRAEEVSQNQSMLELRFSAQGLDKKDLFGKSDPYLEFTKQNPDGSFSVVHRTEVFKNSLNPTWTMFEISSQTLCSSDADRRIKVVCYDWDSDGSHDLIGEFTTTLAEITAAYQSGKKLQWECINPAKQKKRKYKNSGTVYLQSVKITKTYSFLEYIMGGCQVNFTVGVDFTASNGDPRKPSSLHYLDPYRPNEYTRALVAVGSVCQDYDTDKLFPALGFGAKIGEQVSHEFALNGNPQNPYCSGIQGVVQAYHTALQSVQLWGPTNFAPIINHVARFAQQAAGNLATQQQYFILLMLTDGVISDMMETKRAVIHASRLPMSIIIVGVGDANFTAMNELDADEQKLRVGSEVAERDIVQFVPFREFAAFPENLAKALLAEVPGQLTEHMRRHGIAPLTART